MRGRMIIEEKGKATTSRTPKFVNYLEKVSMGIYRNIISE